MKHIDKLQWRVTEGAICCLERLGAKGMSVTQEAYFLKDSLSFPFSGLHFSTLFKCVCVCVCVCGVSIAVGRREVSFVVEGKCFILGCAPCHCGTFQVGRIMQNSGLLWLMRFTEHHSFGGGDQNSGKASQQVLVFLGWPFSGSLRCPQLLPQEEDMKDRGMGRGDRGHEGCHIC